MKKYNGYNAILAGLAAFSYAVSFVILRDNTLSALFLTLSGAFAIPVFVSLLDPLGQADKTFAQTVVTLGVIGAAGTMIHGGYDLANVINPSGSLNPNLPSQVDPRGLLTFAITGIAIFKISWLMSKVKVFPDNLSYLGVLSGTLLMIIYLGRLTVLNPANPILKYPILVEGFIVNPLWYLWLGRVLLNKK